MNQPTRDATSTVGIDALRDRGRRAGRLEGRQPDAAAVDELRALIGPGPHRRDQLIEHLHRLNDDFGALFERHLVALAAEMRLAVVEVYEVASFYHHFEVVRDDAQAPALTLRVCGGLACAMAGSAALLEHLGALRQQGVRVVAAPCVGRCEQAPVAVVDQAPVPQANAAAVRAQVARALVDVSARRPADAADDGVFDPAAAAPCAVAVAAAAAAPSDAARAGCEGAPAYVGYDAYRARGGYRLAAGLAGGARDPDAVLALLEDSGLRGLGGAGFAAARKWRIVRAQAAPRLLVVNIDEGEPGTFKDRTYLERDPHRLLEGVLVAAQVVGIDAAYLYLRDEYAGCRAILGRELARLRADPPCRLPYIELRRGAGAYICGEESALLESLEGRRGQPRLRPPYIAQVGLFGRPTLENNFETLYWVRDIVERGAQWFAGFGRHGRHGLRSFSVSGRVRAPGVKLAPAGITLRELVDEYCGGMADGQQLYAFLPGGASGGILPATLADVPLDFDTLAPHGAFIGSAAVIVLGQHDKARDAALNAMRFFADESCGQCTPCRVGTDKAARLMATAQWDHATLDDLAAVLADASICGLGQAAPNVIRCVQRYFADEVGGAA